MTSGTFSLHPGVCKGPGAGSDCALKKLDRGPSGEKASGEDVGRVRFQWSL